MPLEKQSQYFTLQYGIVAKANTITLTQTESSALEESGGFRFIMLTCIENYASLVI